MLGCFSLAELDLTSNLLNKIQFNFEVVACLILGKVCINFGPALQGGV